MVDERSIAQRLSPENLDKLFPPERADRFFEALLGDVSEGAYDIRLALTDVAGDRLELAFQLQQRPGKCLRCSLTYGLPRVFSRHPVIGLDDLVAAISLELEGLADCSRWEMGSTREMSPTLHSIPLTVFIDPEGQ